MIKSHSFADRVILVCGVARGGIGGATVRLLSSLGATLVCVDRTQATLDGVLAQIQRGHGIVADLTDPAQTDGLIDGVVATFGQLDGIANVAGGSRPGDWRPLVDVETTAFREVVNLNLEYVFRICRDAARSAIARDAPAAMVNVSSVSALNSAPMHGPYGAAKAGMIALTRTMAFEWARHGIRVNCVSLGVVPSERVTATGVNPQRQAPETTSDVVQTSVDELANAIVFLLSDLASGITGHNLIVDSGVTTRNAVLSMRMNAAKRVRP